MILPLLSLALMCKFFDLDLFHLPTINLPESYAISCQKHFYFCYIRINIFYISKGQRALQLQMEKNENEAPHSQSALPAHPPSNIKNDKNDIIEGMKDGGVVSGLKRTAEKKTEQCQLCW